MADVNVTDLTQETYSTMDGTEQVIMFDSAEGKRATVAAVGEYVLKKLTTSLNGSTQTVAAALASLNSEISTATSNNNIETAGINNMTLGASLSLPAGKYILIGSWNFGTGSSSGARNNQVVLGTSSSNYDLQRLYLATEAYCKIQTICTVTLTATTTVYIKASSSMTYTSSEQNRITAIKLP